MRLGSTAKVLAKCKLKYYRISEWDMGCPELDHTDRQQATC